MTEDKKSDKFEIEIEEQESSKQKASNKADIDLELEIMDEQMGVQKGNDKVSDKKTTDIEEDFEKDLDIAVGKEKNKETEIKATRLSQNEIDDFEDIELEAELSAVPPQKQKKSLSKSLLFAAIALIAIGGGGYYALQQPQIKEFANKFSSLNSNNIVAVSSQDNITKADIVDTEEIVDIGIDFPAPEIVHNQEEQDTTLPTENIDTKIVRDVAEISDIPTENITEEENLEDISEKSEISNNGIEIDETSNNEITENLEETSQNTIITEDFSSTKMEETKIAEESFAKEEIVKNTVDNVMPNDMVMEKADKLDNLPATEEKDNIIKDHKTKEAGKFETKEMPKFSNDYVRKDIYYDAPPSIDGMQIQKTGPRKVNPSVEPGSRFVVVEQSPDTDMIEAQIVAAKRAMKLARYEAAVDIYESLYKKNKRDERILMGLAVAYQKTGQDDRAVQIYEQLSDINPKNSDAMVNMLGLIRQQYPEVALKKLINLKNKYPDNAGIYAQLGVVNADLKNYKEAIKNLSIASSMEPKNAMHLFNMAIISERMRNTKAAIKYYEQSLEIDSLYGAGRTINRKLIYDRLSKLRRQQ